MQTASFISGRCVMHSHFFPFTPFDPDLWVLLFLSVRLHTINVCHLLRDHKNSGPSLTRSPLAALSPCIWAGDLLLVVLGHPPSLSITPTH